MAVQVSSSPPGNDPLTRVLLVRHGQSVANARRIWQGHADYPLSEQGLAEAKSVASAVVARCDVGAIWTSPLQRASQTAATLGALTGLEVRDDDRLKEIDVGAASGLTADEVHERFPERAVALAKGLRWAFPGQEDPAAFHGRIMSVLEEMLALEGPVVAFTHGGVIGRIASELLGIGPHRAWPFSVGNCSITEITVERNGAPVLVRLNDTCHLDGLATG